MSALIFCEPLRLNSSIILTFIPLMLLQNKWIIYIFTRNNYSWITGVYLNIKLPYLRFLPIIITHIGHYLWKYSQRNSVIYELFKIKTAFSLSRVQKPRSKAGMKWDSAPKGQESGTRALQGAPLLNKKRPVKSGRFLVISVKNDPYLPLVFFSASLPIRVHNIRIRNLAGSSSNSLDRAGDRA